MENGTWGTMDEHYKSQQRHCRPPPYCEGLWGILGLIHVEAEGREIDAQGEFAFV